MRQHIENLQENLTIHNEIIEDLENKVIRNEEVTELILNPLFKSWEDIKSNLEGYGIGIY